MSAVEFERFPHTPHLAWIGSGTPRADKVLSPQEASQLLASEVTVEEKVDGANVGFSLDAAGNLRVQNRGEYLQHGAHPQFQPLWPWLDARRTALAQALRPGLVLFGEWCFAVHSIQYRDLPDWFLGFDVFDREEGTFWSTDRREALLAHLGLAGVPRLGRGHFSLAQLLEMMGPSRLGAEAMEGIYVRRENELWLEDRVKLVRAEFNQAIEEHWSARRLQKNRLASR